MRNLTRSILKITLLSIIIIFIQSCADTDGACYITNTGSKYHRAGCRYLHSSAISIDCDVARIEGYGACSVCKP